MAYQQWRYQRYSISCLIIIYGVSITQMTLVHQWKLYIVPISRQLLSAILTWIQRVLPVNQACCSPFIAWLSDLHLEVRIRHCVNITSSVLWEMLILAIRLDLVRNIITRSAAVLADVLGQTLIPTDLHPDFSGLLTYDQCRPLYLIKVWIA